MRGLEPEERGEKRDQEEKVEQDGGGQSTWQRRWGEWGMGEDE